MRRERLISELKRCQSSGEDPLRRRVFVRRFSLALNPRVYKTHGQRAVAAIGKLIDDMFANPTHPSHVLAAMLQLCRDNATLFHEVEDDDLVSRIMSDSYFNPLPLDRLFVETQDGIV